MSIKDSSQGYSWLSIAFHWVTAITVITLWLLANIAHDVPEEQGYKLMGLHISIAMTIYLIFWARIFWRLSNQRPAPSKQNRFLTLLAAWVPALLLVGIALMLSSGPFIVWSGGYDINIFNVLTLPSPMEKSEQLHDIMETVHGTGAAILFFGVILHVLGGLKHLIFDRDGTLKKIFIANNK